MFLCLAAPAAALPKSQIAENVECDIFERDQCMPTFLDCAMTAAESYDNTCACYKQFGKCYFDAGYVQWLMILDNVLILCSCPDVPEHMYSHCWHTLKCPEPICKTNSEANFKLNFVFGLFSAFTLWYNCRR